MKANIVWKQEEKPEGAMLGDIKCPNCGRFYQPVLKRPSEKDDRCIQDIYPNAQAWEREQLLTGICSNQCWKEYLGGERNGTRNGN